MRISTIRKAEYSALRQNVLNSRRRAQTTFELPKKDTVCKKSTDVPEDIGLLMRYASQ